MTFYLQKRLFADEMSSQQALTMPREKTQMPPAKDVGGALLRWRQGVPSGNDYPAFFRENS
ncbi:MAG: hypothetical protein LUI08_04590 [Prevotella sp.]|nr:hypothetical protein [Prevotella sp.]